MPRVTVVGDQVSGCRVIRFLVLFVEEGLEYEGCGDLVDNILVLLPCAAGLVEDLVSLPAGEALVPQVDGQAGQRAEFSGESLDSGGARALVAGDVQRIADDDAGDGVAAGYAGDGAEVVARIAAGFERHDGLSREAEFIGHGDADAPGAHVEAEMPGWRSFDQQLLLPPEYPGAAVFSAEPPFILPLIVYPDPLNPDRLADL